jgi:subtilisin family serine protease
MKPSILASALFLALATHSHASPDQHRYIIQVDNGNKGLVTALTKQMGGELKLSSNGFIAASFNGKDINQVRGLLNHPAIKLIEQDHPRAPYALFNDDAGDPMSMQLTPYAVYQSQADQLTFNINSDIKVCVIDSGLDISNSDFNWGTITGDNDSGTGNWYENGGPHGTHVAGTIAAQNNQVGVVGMAPGVPLHIIKVFNASGWGYSSDLAHATNLCTQAGANIINMSLGGGGANSTESNAFQGFVDNGGLIVAAAGNDGNSVRSYPAGYSSVMMIGANDANNQIAEFSQFPSCLTGRGKRQIADETICVEVTAGGVDTLSTYPAGMATNATLMLDGVTISSAAMENNGNVQASGYFMGTAESIDTGAQGKVCVIDRGNISFHDKVLNCENSGGVGAVIINNETGMLFGTLGDPNLTSIPAVGTALEDRSQILAATLISLNIGTSDYGFMSGTSMATPAVAGVAALVWSNHPDCSGEDIRSALKASALDAGTAGKDVYFGYGIVQAKAMDTYLIDNPCSGGNTGGEGDLTLSLNGYKDKGSKVVDLTWSGSSATNVDIYRNGSLLLQTTNNGFYTDNIGGKGGGSYSYQVCEAGTSICSATMTFTF